MQNYLVAACLLLCVTSCVNLHHIEVLPKNVYTITAKSLAGNVKAAVLSTEERNKIRNITVEQTDSLITFTPSREDLPTTKVSIQNFEKLQLHWHTFDIDILTIPFKIRPSVQGFPEQLNANFSAALYLGRRRDIYRIQTTLKNTKRTTKISGVGFGYGGFIGLGGVTMNPFVTQGKIIYEYDGLVINSGIAAIYDAKKFNIGLAVGTDYLVDNNRKDWIYQQKPWFDVLLGINLN
jgi:hypothetical protein